MSIRQLRVAAVQLDCRPGCVHENLGNAARWVEEAARRGAELILLPEFAPIGYLLAETIWEWAEPMDGPIVRTLQELARRSGIYLGTTFLEADGEDFYNSFVLVTPTGELAGRVRKSPPASLEAYFYRAGSDAHVLETGLGRIGVGTCYENLLYERLYDLYQAKVDLVLQPAAAGRPSPLIPGDVARFDRTVKQSALRYAQVLGVPVVMADRSGPFATPLPGGTQELHSTFPGCSRIVDADGTILAALGEEEGVIVADVHLDPRRRAARPPRRVGRRWALRVPWYAFLWLLTQRQGERAYRANERRKACARAISSRRVPT